MTVEAVKTWKKIVIVSFAGGVGFALGAAIIVGVVVWYSNRPKPPLQWDAKSLKATYNTIRFDESKDTFTLAFEYNVLNTTTKTYEVNTSSLTLMAVLTDGKELSRTFSDYHQSGDVTIEAPKFIPPGDSGKFIVNVPYSQELSDSDKNNLKKISALTNERLKELNSIVIFDEVNHYRIDLPSGWANSPGVKEGTKPEIDPSLLKKKMNTTDLPPCPQNDPLGIRGQPCQPQAPKAGTPPCPENDPAGLYAKSPCTPLPGRTH